MRRRCCCRRRARTMSLIAACLGAGRRGSKRAAADSLSTPRGRVTMAWGEVKAAPSAVVTVTPASPWVIRVTTVCVCVGGGGEWGVVHR